MLGFGHMRSRPIETGKHAGQRSGEAGDAVGDDRQTESGEALRIAIGIEHERIDLRLGALDDMREDRLAAEQAKIFIAAAHALRLAACQQHAGNLHRKTFIYPSSAIYTSSATFALRPARRGSSGTLSGSLSKTMRCTPASAVNRLPLARPISVRSAFCASSTPQAVKPERETRIGMRICTHLITISEVRRPVV